tara:strand:+ start:831 stop:1343 length:513 start_codon:yes stop_codon:yes gene_type:complete
MARWTWEKGKDEEIAALKQQLMIEQSDKETILQSLMIGAHPPGELPPYVPPDKPSSPWNPGKSPAPSRDKLMLAHGEGRGPQPKYHDEYNRELPIPPWMQMDPSGELFEIPWMKEKYLNEHPELKISSSRSIRDHLKPGTTGLRDYDKSGGGRGIPEDEWLKLIRSAPKA